MSTGAGASDLLHAEDTGVDEIISGGAPVAARSPLQLFWRRLRRDKVALGALGFIVALIVCAALAGPITKLLGATRAERPVDRCARRLRPPRGPQQRAPVRRRPDRPRRLLARALRRPGLAHGRVRRHGPLRAHRRDDGTDRRVLPRLGRHGDRPRDRHPARLPGAAAGPRPRHGVLRSRRLPGRGAAARPLGRHLHHHHRQLALRRAHHPRPGALAAREGVRRGVEVARRVATGGSSSARSSRTSSRRSSSTRRCSSRRTSCSRRRSASSAWACSRRIRRGARCSPTRPRSSTPRGGTCSSRAWRCC